MQRIGTHGVEAPRERSVAACRDFLIVSRHVADHTAVRALVVIFAHGAVDVFHANLSVKTGALNRGKAEFKRGDRLGVAAREIVVQEHERVHGAEFQVLATHHAFFDHISPEMFRFDTDTVVHEIFHILVVDSVALIGGLLVFFGAFLFRRLGACRVTASRFVRFAGDIVKEPRVQGRKQEVVAEDARLEFPVQTVVVRHAANRQVVRGYLEVFGIEAAQLHIAHGIIPQCVGVDGHADVEFARLVGKVRLEVTIVPGFDILAERGFQKEMEITVARTERKRKERLDMFLVAASVF